MKVILNKISVRVVLALVKRKLGLSWAIAALMLLVSLGFITDIPSWATDYLEINQVINP